MLPSVRVMLQATLFKLMRSSTRPHLYMLDLSSGDRLRELLSALYFALLCYFSFL